MWAEMLADPRHAQTVLAPTAIPEPMSVAHLYRQIDLTAADCVDGKFVVILQPSVKNPIIVSHGSARYPTVGSAYLACYVGDEVVKSTSGVTYIAGLMSVTPGDGTLQPVRYVLSADDTVGGTTRTAFKVNTDAAATLTLVVKNLAHADCQIGWRGNTGAAWSVLQATTVIPAGTTIVFTIAAAAAAYLGHSILVYGSGGGAIGTPDDWKNKIQVSLSTSAGNVPAAISPQSVLQLAKAELLAAGDITRGFVTAMSGLITNVSDMDSDGGQISASLLRRSDLAGADSTTALFNLVNQNTNANRFYNGPLKEGAYCWYFPDDLSSYAPNDDLFSDNSDDNVIIFAGTISANGSLRIAADFIVQFWCPKQVFTKQYTPALNDSYSIGLSTLAKLNCASPNAWHENLISTVKSSLRSAFNWAANNPDKVASGLMMAASVL